MPISAASSAWSASVRRTRLWSPTASSIRATSPRTSASTARTSRSATSAIAQSRNQTTGVANVANCAGWLFLHLRRGAHGLDRYLLRYRGQGQQDHVLLAVLRRSHLRRLLHADGRPAAGRWRSLLRHRRHGAGAGQCRQQHSVGRRRLHPRLRRLEPDGRRRRRVGLHPVHPGGDRAAAAPTSRPGIRRACRSASVTSRSVRRVPITELCPCRLCFHHGHVATTTAGWSAVVPATPSMPGPSVSRASTAATSRALRQFLALPRPRLPASTPTTRRCGASRSIPPTPSGRESRWKVRLPIPRRTTAACRLGGISPGGSERRWRQCHDGPFLGNRPGYRDQLLIVGKTTTTSGERFAAPPFSFGELRVSADLGGIVAEQPQRGFAAGLRLAPRLTLQGIRETIAPASDRSFAQRDERAEDRSSVRTKGIRPR